MVNVDMLYPLTLVGLDLQLIEERGYYPVSFSVFGNFGLIWALDYSLIIYFYCISFVEPLESILYCLYLYASIKAKR